MDFVYVYFKLCSTKRQVYACFAQITIAHINIRLKDVHALWAMHICMSCKTVTRVSMTVNVSVATSMPSVMDPKTTLSVCKLKPKLIGNQKQTETKHRPYTSGRLTRNQSRTSVLQNSKQDNCRDSMCRN